MRKELNIQYVFYYEYDEYEQALNLLASNQLDWQPLVTGKVGLDGISEAFKLVQQPDSHAKILIDPWQAGSPLLPIHHTHHHKHHSHT